MIVNHLSIRFELVKVLMIFLIISAFSFSGCNHSSVREQSWVLPIDRDAIRLKLKVIEEDSILYVCSKNDVLAINKINSDVKWHYVIPDSLVKNNLYYHERYFYKVDSMLSIIANNRLFSLSANHGRLNHSHQLLPFVGHIRKHPSKPILYYKNLDVVDYDKDASFTARNMLDLDTVWLDYEMGAGYNSFINDKIIAFNQLHPKDTTIMLNEQNNYWRVLSNQTGELITAIYGLSDKDTVQYHEHRDWQTIVPLYSPKYLFLYDWNNKKIIWKSEKLTKEPTFDALILPEYIWVNQSKLLIYKIDSSIVAVDIVEDNIKWKLKMDSDDFELKGNRNCVVDMEDKIITINKRGQVLSEYPKLKPYAVGKYDQLYFLRKDTLFQKVIKE
jgi:hypothetical protein